MFFSRARLSSLLFFSLLFAYECRPAISKSATQKAPSPAHRSTTYNFQTVPLAAGDTWIYRTTAETDGKLVSVDFSRYRLGSANQRNQFPVFVTDEPDLPFSNSEDTEDSSYAIDADACMIDFSDRTSLVKDRSCQTILNEESAWNFENIRDGLHVTRKFMTLGHEPIQLFGETYDAVRIESISAMASGAPGAAAPSIDDPRAFQTTYWYVPEFRAVVKKVVQSPPLAPISQKFTSELVSYTGNRSKDTKNPATGVIEGIRMPNVVMVDDDSESLQGCVPPTYPYEAARYNLEGNDILALLIDSEGRVAEWKILQSSGWKILDDATVRLLSKCRYEVATEGGEPVSSWRKIRYVWKMSNKDGKRVPPSLIQNSCTPSSNLFIVNDKSQTPIRLRFLVNTKGTPFGIKIENGSGDENVDREAVDMLKTCRFNPETLNGKPTEGALSIRLATSPNEKSELKGPGSIKFMNMKIYEVAPL